MVTGVAQSQEFATSSGTTQIPAVSAEDALPSAGGFDDRPGRLGTHNGLITMR
jgi:hypothetical protein